MELMKVKADYHTWPQVGGGGSMSLLAVLRASWYSLHFLKHETGTLDSCVKAVLLKYQIGQMEDDIFEDFFGFDRIYVVARHLYCTICV